MIGCLSMLFGEVLAGSSRAWFLDPWGLLVTLPLYLSHVLALVLIAKRAGRISLVSLYCLGMVFGLYEALLTKVLWAGYWDATGAGFGKLAGISLAEFPMLIFFWHPVMSFILPVVAFQWLTTGRFAADHVSLIRLSKVKIGLLVLLAGLISTFLASGSNFNLVDANVAVIGSIALCWTLSRFAKGAQLSDLVFQRRGSFVLFGFIATMYLAMTFLVLPNHLPKEPIAYLSIIMSYVVAIWLFMRTKPKQADADATEQVDPVAKRCFVALIVIYVASLNFWITQPEHASNMLAVLYLALYGAGSLFFLLLVYRQLKPIIIPAKWRRS